MKYFEYKTKNRVTGNVFKGIVTADDLEAATDTLKRRGEDIIEIDTIRDVLNIRKTLYNLSAKPGKKVVLEFFTMVRFMLESGMSLHETLVSIRDASGVKQLRTLAGGIADEVRKGASLSLAMKKTSYFDEATVEQINAGEESGNINETIARLIKQMERDMEFKSKLKNAMIYPVIICIVMVAVLWVMMTMVVPSLADTLVSMGGELPLITEIVIAVSHAMKAATPYMVLCLLVLVVAYKFAVRHRPFKLVVDTYKLKIPIAGGMLEKIELSRFAKNLSAMQKSGITLVRSLNIVNAAVKNVFLAQKIEKACRLVELSGMNLATALSKSGNFPKMMLQLIEVGINAGQITDVLDRISVQYENEVDVLLKRVTSLIEPIMIVFVGLLAGTVVISIFLPMFSLMDTIGA